MQSLAGHYTWYKNLAEKKNEDVEVIQCFFKYLRNTLPYI